MRISQQQVEVANKSDRYADFATAGRSSEEKLQRHLIQISEANRLQINKYKNKR